MSNTQRYICELLILFISLASATLPATLTAANTANTRMKATRDFHLAIQGLSHADTLTKCTMHYSNFTTHCAATTDTDCRYCFPNKSLTKDQCSDNRYGSNTWTDVKNTCCNDGKKECKNSPDGQELEQNGVSPWGCCESCATGGSDCAWSDTYNASAGAGITVCGTTGSSCAVCTLDGATDGDVSSQNDCTMRGFCKNVSEAVHDSNSCANKQGTWISGVWITVPQFNNDMYKCLGNTFSKVCQKGTGCGGAGDVQSCAQNGGSWETVSVADEKACEALRVNGVVTRWSYFRNFEEGTKVASFKPTGIMNAGSKCDTGPVISLGEHYSVCNEDTQFFQDIDAGLSGEAAFKANPAYYSGSKNGIFQFMGPLTRSKVVKVASVTAEPEIPFTSNICFLTMLWPANQGLVKSMISGSKGHLLITEPTNYAAAESIDFESGKATILGGTNAGKIQFKTAQAVRLWGTSNTGSVEFSNSADVVIGDVTNTHTITFTDTSATFVNVVNEAAGVVTGNGGKYYAYNIINKGKIIINKGTVDGMFKCNTGTVTIGASVTGTIAVDGACSGTVNSGGATLTTLTAIPVKMTIVLGGSPAFTTTEQDSFKRLVAANAGNVCGSGGDSSCSSADVAIVVSRRDVTVALTLTTYKAASATIATSTLTTYLKSGGFKTALNAAGIAATSVAASGGAAGPTPSPTNSTSPTPASAPVIATVEHVVTVSSVANKAAYTISVAEAYDLGYAKTLGLTKLKEAKETMKAGCSVTSVAEDARRAGVSITFTAIAPAAATGGVALTAAAVNAAVTGAALATQIKAVIAANNITGVTAPSAADITPKAAVVSQAQVAAAASSGGGSTVIIVVVVIAVIVLLGGGVAAYMYMMQKKGPEEKEKDPLSPKSGTCVTVNTLSMDDEKNGKPPGASYMKNGQWFDEEGQPLQARTIE